MLLNDSLISSPSSLRLFVCPSFQIIMFNGFLAQHVVIYHGVALNYNFYPILFFGLFCYLLPVVVLIFTHLLFVLVFYLNRLLLVPALHCTTESSESSSIPFNHLQQPYWLTPYYADIFTAHNLPYIDTVLRLLAFFWILEP